MKILMLGEIVGKMGVDIIKKNLPRLKEENEIDIVCCCSFFSILRLKLDDRVLKKLFDAGIDTISVGNSVFSEHAEKMFDKFANKLLPPINHPLYYDSPLACGSIEINNTKFKILNLCGRVGNFTALGSESIPCLSSPFEAFEQRVKSFTDDEKLIVSFYSHSTDEKECFSYYLDGRAEIMTGYGTLVKTADEKILPENLKYITDLGRIGVQTGVAGMKPDKYIKMYSTLIPQKFRPIHGESEITGTLIELPDKISSFFYKE